MERMSSLTGTEAIPTNELAQLQNKILRELRRIHGSQKIPRSKPLLHIKDNIWHSLYTRCQ